MKCALELVAIATAKAEEIAKEKALKEAAERKAREVRTIQFCEKLEKELESQAERGKTPETTFHLDKWSCPLTVTYNDYADGRKSYRGDHDSIDLDMVKEWLAKYCFVTHEKDFEHSRYGWGKMIGLEIHVIPDPDCLQ